MAKFIELPIGDGLTTLVNLDRVCEIRPNYKFNTKSYEESRTVIYFSDRDTSYINAPFADVRRLVLEATEGRG